MSPSADAPRPYFAYSLALDTAMAALGAGVVGEALDVDLVYDRPSSAWGGRVAGLADRPGQSVFGRLFEVPADRWSDVRQREEKATGASVERTVRVRLSDGRLVQAMALTTDPARSDMTGRVSERFMDALIRSAEQARLPADYVEKLMAEALILKRIQGLAPRR